MSSAARLPAPTAAIAARATVLALLLGLPLAVLGVPLTRLVLLFASAAAVAALGRPERWLAAYIWVLPFHTLAMMLLFGPLGMAAQVVRMIASWKELALVAVVGAVAATAAVGVRPRLRVAGADLAVVALIALALAHLAVQMALGVSDVARAASYGLRDSVVFMLLYFVGRATPSVADGDRALRALVGMGVVTTLFGVLERFLLPVEAMTLIGVTAYYRDFLSLGSFLMEDQGVPINLWTWLGGHAVRRMGSVYFSGQGFAVPFLLIVPAATVLLLCTRRGRSLKGWGVYALIWAGLIASITRMTIIACAAQALMIALMLRRGGFVAAMATAAGAAAAGAALVSTRVAAFIWETLTWQTASSETHLADYVQGGEALLEHPLGAGLGTTDMTAARLGRLPLTGDNLFLKYGVELGIPGLILHLLVLMLILHAAVRAFRDEDAAPDARRFAVAVAAMTAGIAINGLTGVVYNHQVVSFVFFWLAGSVVTLANRRHVRAGPVHAAEG